VDTARYAELFLTESREHLSAINGALLEMERAPSADAVGALFRAVHTVKGMSATMGYTAVADLSHELETLLDRVRRGAQELSAAVMDALFRAADVLEAAIEAVVAGAPDAPGVLVRVRIAPDAPLRGVRAFIALGKAKALGEVTALVPAAESLQAGEFGRDFALRLVTGADAATIERQIRLAGDVDEVEVGGAAGPAAPDAAPTDVGTAGESAPLRQQRHVRIDLRRLDALMNLIGELVIARGRLTQLAAASGQPALEEAVTQTSRLVTDLQAEIMTSRMVPVWQVFDRFPRLVRDAAHALGKQVNFTVDGKEIELDRSMLDEIGDPVMHLLRNAVDHGIELPEQRVRAGKSPVGELTLSAVRDRSSVLVRVTDDGRGLDRNKVLARAREAGLVEPGKQELTDDELMRLISRPGFSTAERVTDISGRGVGVDAVMARVRALGGSIEMRSAPGEGTSVTVRLPLTLAIVRALLARAGDETYALPLTHVSETVDITPSMLRTVRGRDVLVWRDEVLPLVRLRDVVHHPDGRGRGAERQAVVVEVGARQAALVVDELAGQQEIVVKQFDGVRGESGGAGAFSGATILGDGAPALIVDVSSLL
jgi:two-component system chemotaxis sensor kinase CheA